MSEIITNSSIFIPVLGKRVGRLAFGCEVLGGYQWGKVCIDEIRSTIDLAINTKDATTLTMFDTADTYGPKLSEERLGDRLLGKRSKVVLASKFGVRLTDGKAWYDNSPDYADRALDASLERLKVDKIDLYQIHWPDGKTPLPKIFKKLEEFRADGRIMAYGVSNFDPGHILPLAKEFPGLCSFSLPFSILQKNFENGIEKLSSTGLIFLPYGCLSQGLLSGKYGVTSKFQENDRRRGIKYQQFHGAELKKNLEILKKLKKLSNELNVPLTALALLFVLTKFPHAIPIVGAKTRHQFLVNSSALTSRISSQTLKFLEGLKKHEASH